MGAVTLDVTKVLGGSPLSTTDLSVTKVEGATLASTGPARLSATKIVGAAILGPPICTTYNFTLRIMDADGCVALKPCEVTICPD